MSDNLTNTSKFDELITPLQFIAPVSKKNIETLSQHKDFPLFKAYLSYLKYQKRYSPQTLRAYSHGLASLASITPSKNVNTVTSQTIRHTIGQIRMQGLKSSAIAQRLSIWRSYMRWLERETGIPSNPIDNIKTKTLKKRLPQALTVDQMQHLLDNKNDNQKIKKNRKNTKFIAFRNQAIMELFYSSGLRLSELIGLNVHYTKELKTKTSGWLDMTQSQINVIGKGNKRRFVPIGKKAFEAINNWLSARKEIMGEINNTTQEPALFISTQRKRISSSAVRNIVVASGIKSNIPVHLHPHMLRHSFASHLLQSSNDIRAVQELLGHKSISSTQIYTSLDFQYLSKAYDAAHPRAFSKKDKKR